MLPPTLYLPVIQTPITFFIHFLSYSCPLNIIFLQCLMVFVVLGATTLVFAANATHSPTYEATVEAICGSAVKVFAELCLIVFCFGSNTAYLVVIADQLEDSECHLLIDSYMILLMCK